MKKFYFFLFLVSTLYLVACKTAVKAYDKGNYTEAIELGIKKLHKDPADGETKALLQSAYRQAVSEREAAIRHLSSGTAARNYEQIYTEYAALQELYNQISSQPALTGVVRPTDYSEYVTTYRNKTAEVYQQEGESRMSLGTKPGYREAYTYFQKALRYQTGSAELRRQADEAYRLATVHVVVLPLSDYYGGGYRYTSSYAVRNFEDQLLRNLRYHSNTDFVKFYSEWDARSAAVQPDEVLELRLGRLDIGRPYDEQRVQEVSRNIVVKETVYKPDSVVKQYAKVTAQIITTRRTLVSEGELYITARTPQGAILWNDRVQGDHRWQTEFVTYRGDERALSETDKAALNRNTNFNDVPREDEIQERIFAELSSDLQYRLRNRYSRYY